jgi:hypothetical protein
MPWAPPATNKEDMLAAAGFTLVPANTPQRQAVNDTPPNAVPLASNDSKVVVNTYGFEGRPHRIRGNST